MFASRFRCVDIYVYMNHTFMNSGFIRLRLVTLDALDFISISVLSREGHF